MNAGGLIVVGISIVLVVEFVVLLALLILSMISDYGICWELPWKKKEIQPAMQRMDDFRATEPEVEVGYKTITAPSYRNNPEIQVWFSIDSHGWSQLEQSEDWKSFVKHLEEFQNQQNQKSQKDRTD